MSTPQHSKVRQLVKRAGNLLIDLSGDDPDRTFTLSSETLDSDQLATLAAGLKLASDRPN